MIQLFIIWLIGAIVSFLALSWMKNPTFKLNIDKDGAKVLCSLLWIFILFYEVARFFVNSWDAFVEKSNKQDSRINAIATKIGSFIRSFK